MKKVLLDMRFHSPKDLGEPSVVVRMVEEYIADGYAFDVAKNKLRLRLRREREPLQSVMEVVGKLDFDVPVKKQAVEKVAAAEAEPDELFGDGSESEGAGDDGGSEVDGLVLSDPAWELTLPRAGIEALTGVVFAKKGVGKTYLGGVFFEELLGADPPVPVVVFDPLGAWWGIGATASGSPSSYEVLILGGKHGHYPLSPTDGKRVAKIFCELRPKGLLLDQSGLTASEKCRVAADFCEALETYEPFPLHMLFDEVDVYAPQSLQREEQQKRSLAKIEWWVMRGRLRGVGVTGITLRPPLLSINVRSQVDALWLLSMTEPRDLGIVDGMLEHRVTDQQRTACVSELPVLPKATAFFLRGGDDPIFRRFSVRRKRSWDSSSTLTTGATVKIPRTWSPPDDVLGEVARIMKGAAA